MKIVNGVEYEKESEFIASLRELDDTYSEKKTGERFRAPGREALFFRSKGEARDFWRSLPKKEEV